MEDNKYKYKLKYNFSYEHDEKGYVEEDAKDESTGLADAVLLFSILNPPDGSLGVADFSINGRTGRKLPDTEKFKVFTALANFLASSENIPTWQQKIAELTFDTIGVAIQSELEKSESKVKH